MSEYLPCKACNGEGSINSFTKPYPIRCKACGGNGGRSTYTGKFVKLEWADDVPTLDVTVPAIQPVLDALVKVGIVNHWDWDEGTGEPIIAYGIKR